nr:hypothetical protein [Streptomyces sp. SJL17-1]
MDAPHAALGGHIGLRDRGLAALRRRFRAGSRPSQPRSAPLRLGTGWLNLYWSSLALFATLAAVFLIRGKRRGTDLVCAIMATDLAANWYAVYGIQHSSFAAQPGLQRMTVFAALVLGTAPFIRRHLTE